jgi:hypothetical protein
MSNYRNIIVGLFLLISISSADEVYFYNGKIIKNCEVKETADGKVKIITFVKEIYLFEKSDFISKEQLVLVSEIYKTVKSTFNQNNETQILYGEEISQPSKSVIKESVQDNYISQIDNNIELLVGIGLNGFTGNEDIPLSYTFSFGLSKNSHTILSTLSYGEFEKLSIVRVAGFSTKYLVRIQNNIYLGAGPEIHITILGLMKLHIGALLCGNIADDIKVTVGYSGFDKINCGILFTL